MRGMGAITAAIIAAIVVTLLVTQSLLWVGITGASPATSTVNASIQTQSDPTTEAFLSTSEATSVAEVAAQAIDAIVAVNVTIDSRGPLDASGSGSGVIISSDGTIVTNAHVVESATSITVELTDGTTYPAIVLVENTGEDIAILDIDALGLTTIELGSTSDVAVGDPVIAIGNPLALEGGPSVSTGIVSALDRKLEEVDTTLEGIIQTDAAITEGSSGGALLDADGYLIGITTAVGVSSVGVEGIAFAVPVETVSSIVASLNVA